MLGRDARRRAAPSRGGDCDQGSCSPQRRVSVPITVPVGADRLRVVVRSANIFGILMIGVAGFEPATPSSRTRPILAACCTANRLSDPHIIELKWPAMKPRKPPRAI